MKIQAPTKLSKEDIDRMVKQAEEFAEADKKKKESIEAKNQADQLIYQSEKELQDFGPKLDDNLKSEISADILELKKTLESGDAEKIKAATDKLNKSRSKMGEAVYKQTGQQPGQGNPQGGPQGAPGAGPEASGKKPDDNVVDADFKVEDDKK